MPTDARNPWEILFANYEKKKQKKNEVASMKGYAAAPKSLLPTLE